MTDAGPLHPIARAILAAIISGEVAATASNADLGVAGGCHQRTACRHLGTLARRGLVRIERIAPNPDGPGTQPTGRRIYPMPTRDPASRWTRPQ